MSDVLEGEVITSRDVAVRIAALRDRPVQQQMHAVTVMLSDSRTRLLAAIAAQDLPGIVEEKAKASTLQEITKQLRLGKDMQLDAAEFLRRAERGLGVALREGQARGEVETESEARSRGAIQRDIRLGRSTTTSEGLVVKPKPRDFATQTELYGVASRVTGVDRPGIYGMTDGISDEVFAEALADAREEEKLSRANVARKARAKASKLKVQEAPPHKVRKTAAARKVMDDLTISINSLVFVINDTDPAEVKFEHHKSDIEDIRRGMNIIKRFLSKVEEQR